MVSRRLEQAEQNGVGGEDLEWARRELYRGQCNCSYWHGAFGGIYLPHLRNAVYNHLIAADNLLDRAIDRASGSIEATVDDYDFDACQEIRLLNDQRDRDVRAGSRRNDVRAGCAFDLPQPAGDFGAASGSVPSQGPGGGPAAATIRAQAFTIASSSSTRDSKTVCSTIGYPRKSLIDHFYDLDANLQSVSRGDAMERGDFAGGLYDARLRRNPDRIQVQMTRAGNAWGVPLRITKGVTLQADSSTLEIAYRIDDIPADAEFHFGVEFNFAGVPAGADDRFFYGDDQSTLGDLGTALDLHDQDRLGLVDRWLGLDLELATSRPTSFWTFPVRTVSMSEGGVELVHQSVVVHPHWWVRGDKHGRWSVTMKLGVDTGAAEQRQESMARSLASG